MPRFIAIVCREHRSAGICGLLIVLGILLSVTGCRLGEYRDRVAAIEITGIDLTKIPDGRYLGSSDAILVAAQVEVVVENHEIVSIRLLKHKQQRGERAESILPRVIEKQSLEVDVVTGATSSSKVILEAIQNALSDRP